MDTVKIYANAQPTYGRTNKPRFIVRTGDMFDIAKEYKNPAIHNFANNECQGGPLALFTREGKFISIKDYGNTQEDQLISLYRDRIILPKEYYPIIQRDKVALLYSRCGHLPAVITLPSIIQPNFKKRRVEDSMLERLDLLIRTAAEHGHTLITGLWGCGVFGMKPEELAQLWQTKLKETYPDPLDIVFVINTAKCGDLVEMFSALNKKL